MRGGFFKLVVGALVVGALMVFAALQFIGTEENQGQLAQMAGQQGPPGPMPQPPAAASPEAVPEPVYENDDWYDAENSMEESLAPAPFDPSPQLDDLPPEDLRFDPNPGHGIGEAQIITPDAGQPVT